MLYDIEFKPRALKDLKALSLRERARIVAKVEGLQNDLVGDVKRLTKPESIACRRLPGAL